MKSSCATLVLPCSPRGSRIEEQPNDPSFGKHFTAPASCITVVLAAEPTPDDCVDPRDDCSTFSRIHSIQVPESAARQSLFFSALLDSGMVESQTRQIELKHLHPRAVKTAVEFLTNQQRTFEEILLSGFRDPDSADLMLRLEEAFDYLQVPEGCTMMPPLLALHGPQGIRLECARQRWITSSDKEFRVIVIPFSKRTRHYRIWVCLALCMQLLPNPCTILDQTDFTAMLEPYSGDVGAVALRRELVEYGLVSRMGDGSAYWRPSYTFEQLGKWLGGNPRKMV